MSRPRGVSVIIPTYNRAAFLTDAIRSVIDQKGNFAIDLIVVDDGSTDDTEEVVAKFGDDVRYHRIEPSGRPAVPRNVGIRMAKYDLIAFQDSDDRWVADKLQLQIGVFDDPNVALSYGNAAKMTDSGATTSDKMIDQHMAKSGFIFENLLNTNFISTLTVMVRKPAFDQVGLFDESPSLRAVEDYHLWLRIAANHKIMYVDEVLAYYREHANNISASSQYKAHLLLSRVYSQLGPLPAAQKGLVHDRCSGVYTQLYRLSGGNPKYLLLSIYHRAMKKLLPKGAS